MQGNGNFVAFNFRIHDPRIGKFLSIDPLSPDYPELTPYQFSSNRPIDFVEIEGLEGSDADIFFQHRMEQTRLYGTDAEKQELRKAQSMALYGAVIIYSIASGGALLSSASLFEFSVPVATTLMNPTYQHLAVEGAAFVGGFFLDGPEDLHSGPGDELGKLFRKVCGNGLEYIFKTLDEIEIPVGNAKVVNGSLSGHFFLPESLQKKGIGTKMYQDIFEQLGDEIQQVQSLWTYDGGKPSVNLQTYLDNVDYLGGSFTQKQAAFLTPSGQWAKENGFTEVKFLYDDVDEVELIFYKPEKPQN